MFDWNHRRRAAGARVLLRLAEERGLPVHTCVVGTGLPADAPAESIATITTQQELRVIANLLRANPDMAGLGALAGVRAPLAGAGPWELAILGSPSGREAVDVTRRYLDSAYPFGRISVEDNGDEITVRLDDSEIPVELREFLTERAAAGFGAVARELFGRTPIPSRVAFRHAAPPEGGRHRDIFGVSPIFGADANVVVYQRGCLDSPLPTPTDRARATCEQLCRDLLARHLRRSGTAAVVRDLLVSTPGRIADQTAVAGELYVSPRTLSRRLNQEGTSFRALLDEVRRTLSEELLLHTDVTTEQLAARLGYAEAASFIRAFRRWNGCPPQEFRTRHSGLATGVAYA